VKSPPNAKRRHGLPKRQNGSPEPTQPGSFGKVNVAVQGDHLDVLPSAPEHAREELLNDLGLQLASGFLPGLYWMNPAANAGLRPRFDPNNSHPPVWVVAADEYLTRTGDRTLTREFFDHARRQIEWFETNRKATPGGYLYHDILMNKWESGVDEGIRFDHRSKVKTNACVDATSHVYQLATYAARWATLIGADPEPWTSRANVLREFIQTNFWSERDGFFFDSWAIEQPELKHQAFEGMWPVVVGAATSTQAQRVIDEWLMRSDRFYSKHPIATVGVSDPKFELRMWRGPTWNSMTYWAALGCVRYGRRDAARKLLEAALDDTAAQLARTGTIWEFYHPQGRNPEYV
jgi:putative isomerase